MAATTKSKPNTQLEAEAENPIVARRLAFIDSAELKKAAKEFREGAPISQLVDKYGFRRTSHAQYGVRQQMVEDGTASRIDSADVDAIKAALKDPDDQYNDWPWLACRTGLSTDRLRKLVES